jgi:hypothetical protein
MNKLLIIHLKHKMPWQLNLVISHIKINFKISLWNQLITLIFNNNNNNNNNKCLFKVNNHFKWKN